MHLNFSKSRQRRTVGILIGLLFSAPIFVNSGSVLEFIGFTVLGVLVAGLTTEGCYRVWRRIRRDNIYLEILTSIVGLVIVVLTLYLTVVSSWEVIEGNSWSCFVDMEKPVENRFTGQCRMVEVCGTTPWYYKEGCSSGDVEASNSCLSAIQISCAAQEEGQVDKPSNCKGQKIPDRYSVQNGTITCPS